MILIKLQEVKICFIRDIIVNNRLAFLTERPILKKRPPPVVPCSLASAPPPPISIIQRDSPAAGKACILSGSKQSC